LYWRRHLLVWGGEETATRNFGSKPIGLGKSNGERDEVLLNLLWREIVANLIQGLNGLRLEVSDQPYQSTANWMRRISRRR
jgi:hypothetical protein